MPDPSPVPVVGIDLGGTSIKAALVSPRYEMTARAHVPTDLRSQRTLIDAIERLVEQVRGDQAVAGVGFGLPSQIDQRRGLVLDSINVPLEDLDFAAEMERRLGVPVAIDNDANVACLAEARIGAARGASHMVMLTLGTGVGGGLLLGGKLYRGSIGAGAELGHMTIDKDGPPCQGHCPNRGCLELFASATGVLRQASAIAAERPGGSIDRALGGTAEVDAHWVIQHAQQGDEEAAEALRRVGVDLGVGIASYINIFNPELVVVGGGISAAGELLLEPARQECVRRVLPAMRSTVRIVAAELGNDAGVLGAAALLFE